MRQCGSCNLCCILFSINDPADEKTGFPGLVKPLGVLCPHRTEQGCSIYDNKGPVCNSYRCLWLSSFLPEWAKPNAIGIVFDRFRKFDKIYMLGHLARPLDAEHEKVIQKLANIGLPVQITEHGRGRFTLRHGGSPYIS